MIELENIDNHALPLVHLELSAIVFEGKEDFKYIGVRAWQVAMQIGEKHELACFRIRMPMLPKGAYVALGGRRIGKIDCVVGDWSAAIVPNQSVAVYCRLSPTGNIVVDCSRKAWLLISKAELAGLIDTGWEVVEREEKVKQATQ